MAFARPVPLNPLFNKILLLEDPVPRAAGLQMSVDQTLLESSPLPILRTYRWESPCVTIGYFESHAAAIESYPTLPVIRRWTGGGLVVHGEDCPYSLIVPREESFTQIRPSEAYQQVHGLLAKALGARLSSITLAEAKAPKRGTACFENPVPADLLRNGQKMGGAGQRRTRAGLLHQGSLQLGGPHFSDARIFAGLLALEVEQTSLSEKTIRQAQELAQSRYDHPDWNTDRKMRPA